MILGFIPFIIPYKLAKERVVVVTPVGYGWLFAIKGNRAKVVSCETKKILNHKLSTITVADDGSRKNSTGTWCPL